jgi:hypothetical protein
MQRYLLSKCALLKGTGLALALIFGVGAPIPQANAQKRRPAVRPIRPGHRPMHPGHWPTHPAGHPHPPVGHPHHPTGHPHHPTGHPRHPVGHPHHPTGHPRHPAGRRHHHPGHRHHWGDHWHHYPRRPVSPRERERIEQEAVQWSAIEAQRRETLIRAIERTTGVSLSGDEDEERSFPSR